MALRTRADVFDAAPRIDTTQIYRASKTVYDIIGQPAPLNKPIVGKNAFLHESGIHQHGVLANKKTYEILTPESVGIRTNNLVLGKHSGHHAFEDPAQGAGLRAEPGGAGCPLRPVQGPLRQEEVHYRRRSGGPGPPLQPGGGGKPTATSWTGSPSIPPTSPPPPAPSASSAARRSSRRSAWATAPSTPPSRPSTRS